MTATTARPIKAPRIHAAERPPNIQTRRTRRVLAPADRLVRRVLEARRSLRCVDAWRFDGFFGEAVQCSSFYRQL